MVFIGLVAQMMSYGAGESPYLIWLNTQVRSKYMTESIPDLEIYYFAKRSTTSILCLIIPVVVGNDSYFAK